MILQGKDIVLGVTGGIAAYKAVEVASRLRKLGAQVFVIMTKNACEFVTPLTFETISNHPVVTDTFERPETWEVEHIALAKRASLFSIAPATANILAKIAHGIADDMLSTTVLATRAPILVAPAMNTNMWEAEATRENMRVLEKRGVMTVGPGIGFLAEGTEGVGRMAEPQEIVDAIVNCLVAKQDMNGLRVLVTAGPTRERLDPVRYLSNDSSGKMGYAIAGQAHKRGARVTLLSGPVHLNAPQGVEVVNVETTQDLYNAMLARCQEYDVIIQAAAPADYRFADPSDQKLKKHGGDTLTLVMVENPDIAAAVGERKKPGQILVGFAAETENLMENAKAKLKKKNADMIVANDVSKSGAGFTVDTNIATLITAKGAIERPLQSKMQLADDILDMVLSLKSE
jgi:phosphopantothenoylcysteine decarboxylase / phosphopantothenate---cysteine ligase